MRNITHLLAWRPITALPYPIHSTMCAEPRRAPQGGRGLGLARHFSGRQLMEQPLDPTILAA
jgi:hypothetical protein